MDVPNFMSIAFHLIKGCGTTHSARVTWILMSGDAYVKLVSFLETISFTMNFSFLEFPHVLDVYFFFWI